MFTGIVEETGIVHSLQTLPGSGRRLVLQARAILSDLQLGHSVAVNGCCLTIVAMEGELLSFDLLGETLARTNLGGLHAGHPVNLERAMGANSRLGGHFVQGHIDCACAIRRFEPRGADQRLELELPPEFARYVFSKGSICVDGISLTVAEVAVGSFTIWVIPHTLATTNLHWRRAGDRLNVEFDILAKTLERIVASRAGDAPPPAESGS